MAKVDIWMPLYIGDYLRDTVELTGPEHGAYLLLLMHYWQKGGEIGCDIERLSRVARSDQETCRFILGYYFELIDGNYKNKRADAEMSNAENRRLASVENGKKGGRPPKNNPGETRRLFLGNLDETQEEPNPKPRSNLDESSSSSSSSSPSSLPSSAHEESRAPINELVPVAPKLSEYQALIREEWENLGGKVYPAPDPIRFASVSWRDIAPCIKGIHSDEVLQAIRNFGTILSAQEGKYYWTQRITIGQFFTRHLERFLPGNFNPRDFETRKKEVTPDVELPPGIERIIPSFGRG